MLRIAPLYNSAYIVHKLDIYTCIQCIHIWQRYINMHKYNINDIEMAIISLWHHIAWVTLKPVLYRLRYNIAHIYSNQIHNSSCIATLTKLHLWLHAVLLPLLFLLENDQHVACYLGLLTKPNFLLIQWQICTAFEYDSND